MSYILLASDSEILMEGNVIATSVNNANDSVDMSNWSSVQGISGIGGSSSVNMSIISNIGGMSVIGVNVDASMGLSGNIDASTIFMLNMDMAMGLNGSINPLFNITASINLGRDISAIVSALSGNPSLNMLLDRLVDGTVIGVSGIQSPILYIDMGIGSIVIVTSNHYGFTSADMDMSGNMGNQTGLVSSVDVAMSIDGLITSLSSILSADLIRVKDITGNVMSVSDIASVLLYVDSVLNGNAINQSNLYGMPYIDMTLAGQSDNTSTIFIVNMDMNAGLDGNVNPTTSLISAINVNMNVASIASGLSDNPSLNILLNKIINGMVIGASGIQSPLLYIDRTMNGSIVIVSNNYGFTSTDMDIIGATYAQSYPISSIDVSMFMDGLIASISSNLSSDLYGIKEMVGNISITSDIASLLLYVDKMLNGNVVNQSVLNGIPYVDMILAGQSDCVPTVFSVNILCDKDLASIISCLSWNYGDIGSPITLLEALIKTISSLSGHTSVSMDMSGNILNINSIPSMELLRQNDIHSTIKGNSVISPLMLNIDMIISGKSISDTILHDTLILIDMMFSGNVSTYGTLYSDLGNILLMQGLVDSNSTTTATILRQRDIYSNIGVDSGIASPILNLSTGLSGITITQTTLHDTLMLLDMVIDGKIIGQGVTHGKLNRLLTIQGFIEALITLHGTIELNIIIIDGEVRIFALDDERRIFIYDEERRMFALDDERRILTVN